jgi:gas vesicle protein
MLSHDRKPIHFTEGIGVGLAAGCLLGILYAPQAGKKTRRRLASAVKDGVGHITSKAEDLAEFARKKTLRWE